MSSKGTTVKERITALEVTVEAHKVQLNQKIDANQKLLMDKIGDCHTAITNHLEHAAEEVKETKNRNWALIIGLIIATAPYIAYGIYAIINHVFFNVSIFGK